MEDHGTVEDVEVYGDDLEISIKIKVSKIIDEAIGDIRNSHYEDRCNMFQKLFGDDPYLIVSEFDRLINEKRIYAEFERFFPNSNKAEKIELDSSNISGDHYLLSISSKAKTKMRTDIVVNYGVPGIPEE